MKKLHLILFSLLLTTACQQTEDREPSEDVFLTIDSLNLELEKERSVSDSLRTIFDQQDSIETGYPLFFGRKYDGIDQPEEFVKNQLRNQPEIIPMSPVLGGKMKFRKIDVISEKWVLAIYDDGHVQGKAIMEYSLQPDGSIRYTIIATQEN